MNKLLLAFAFMSFVVSAALARTETQGKQQPRPFLFMENKGQIHDQHGNAVPSVLFTVAEGDFKAQLTSNGIHYSFQKVNNPEVLARIEEESKRKPEKLGIPQPPDTTAIRYTIQRIDLQLLGANAHPTVITEGRSDYYENYYTPGCGEKGVTDVHGYTQVTYKDIYNGIDWVVYAKAGKLKYDFIVHAGADANQIRIQYKGANGLTINKNGSFTAGTALGNIVEEKPYSFIQSTRQRIVSKYVLTNNVLSFAIAKSTEAIVIDPGIDWSTYFYGSSGSYHWQYGLYADGVGSAYISGYTNSTATLATTGAYQTVMGGIYDAYMAKFNSSGSRLWATYFGGNDYEYWSTVSGDGGANVFLTGYTYSNSGIATAGAYQTVIGGIYDCYLAKFTNAGVLSWATYYGGSNYEYSSSAAADASGNIYISGYTSSTNNISTAGSYQPALSGGNDAFLVKFTSGGARLWATYFGGTGTELGNFVEVNSTGDVYISGTTTSTSGIATAGSFQPIYGGGTYDAYLAKFSTAGSLLWSTYYGGTGQDGYWGGGNYGGRSLKCDASGNIFLCLTTYSTNAIATPGTYQPAISGNGDVALVKFDGNGMRIWGTYYGGPNYEYSGGLAVDNNSNSVYIAGNTYSSTGIATQGAYQTVFMGPVNYDAFFSKFDAVSGQLMWGSYFGGTGYEWGAGIEYEGGGNFYIGGSTSSTTNITTPGSFQSSWGGGNSYEGYLARFSDSVETLHIGTMPLQYCEGDSIHIPFYGSYSFTGGNVFTAELSDVSGNFGTPAVLGTKNSAAIADTIHAQLPLGVSGATYKLRVRSSLPGAISDTLQLIINPLVSPVITVAASNTSVCAAGNIIFTATTTNGGAAPTYQWIKNGTVAATGATYTAAGWAAGDSVYCIVNGNAPCTLNPIDTSNVIHISVLQAIVPTIVITSSGLITCPGQTVSFTAITNNGGTTPVYQWQKNGVNVGANNAIYAANNFANGDVVTCILASSVTCATPAMLTSNPLTISVTTVIPTIQITANDTFYCYGRPATFTVTAVTNAGSLPQYQWMKNGTSVGPNGTIYKDSFFVNGDVVSCRLTSSNPCAVPVQVVSNLLPLKVSAILNPIIIRIGGSTLKVNTSVNPSFVFYQWYFNNSPIPGATTQSIPMNQDGMYQVMVTDTSGCKSVSAIAWIQDLTTSAVNNISKEQVKIYPNPTTGIVNIVAPVKLNAAVRNALGQVVLNEQQVQRIDISHLAAGVYMLILSDKEGKQVTTMKLTKTD